MDILSCCDGYLTDYEMVKNIQKRKKKIYIDFDSENAGSLQDLKDFRCCFLSFLLQDFLTLKKGCRRLLEEKNSTTLFLSFESINSTKQRKKIKHSRQHVPSMERGLKRAANTHYSYTSQTQLHKEINKLGFGADCFLELFWIFYLVFMLFQVLFEP